MSKSKFEPFMKVFLFFSTVFFTLISCERTTRGQLEVGEKTMTLIHEEIKTPYKYGVVFKHSDSSKLVDSPTIFRSDSTWYMNYIVFDGQGYETWMAKSDNLLDWEVMDKVLAFTKDTWDANQKAGYVSLVDTEWGGSYEVEKYNEQYWMTYLGGNATGYETGSLKVGLAYTTDFTNGGELERAADPILAPDDPDARWFENQTIYKSSVIRDRQRLTGYPFVMYYNAKGDTANYESIGMAVSDDMVSWKRFGEDPVITQYAGICGDAQIVKMDDLYVMFYFGAFWKPGAFERFACSYDLMHWTAWEGPDLVSPSEPYDQKYAHKPWVIKWDGVVYHFYCAVGDQGRVIALATSIDLKEQ